MLFNFSYDISHLVYVCVRVCLCAYKLHLKITNKNKKKNAYSNKKQQTSIYISQEIYVHIKERKQKPNPQNMV